MPKTTYEELEELIPSMEWVNTEPDPSWDNSCPICCGQVADRAGHRRYHLKMAKMIFRNASIVEQMLGGFEDEDAVPAEAKAEAPVAGKDSPGHR